MIRLWPAGLAGRTIAVLLIGLGLFHIFSIWAYQFGLESRLAVSREQHFAESLVAARRAIADLPPASRDAAAHALSSATLEVHWADRPQINLSVAEDDAARAMRARLVGFMPELGRAELRVGAAGDHLMLAALPLADGSYINLSAPIVTPGGFDQHGTVASTTAMALGVIIVSILLVRSLTAPLRRLADAADRLGLDDTGVTLAEEGATEVRHATRAFNRMQERIGRLIRDRSQTLAAISHDLRTPITRLRLRAEFLPDDDQRDRMLADLDEMELMLDSTLEFLRVDAARGEVRIVDLATMLETLCGDRTDAGDTVALTAAGPAPVRARPLALKRALSNLIDNAIRHGGAARVALSDEAGQWCVTIDDDGPGIPAADIERMFEPFTRADESRNRHTGGVGLGLTVARSLVRGLGGEVVLANRADGGLRAEVTLPPTRTKLEHTT
jgi:signal transduction histidine kinase